MADYGTFQGRLIDDAFIAEMGAEAEAGYDVDVVLSHRKGGRPALGDGPAKVVPVRLTPDQSTDLDVFTAQDQKSQSDLMRQAWDDYRQRRKLATV